MLLATSTSEAYYISKHSALIGAGKVKVTVIDLITGKQRKHYSLAADPDTTMVGRRFTVSDSAGIGGNSNTPFLAWSEKPHRTLKVNLLGSSKISTVNLDNHSGEEIQSVSIHFPTAPDALPHFLVHLRTTSKHSAEVLHVDIKNGDVSKAYSLPATGEDSAFTASSIDANVYFTRATGTEISLYSSASHGILGRWPRHHSASAGLVHITSEVVSRGKSGFAIRVAETSTQGEWSLVRNGETVWSRPEMLAYVTAAVWADGDIDDAAIHALEEEIHSNPLNAYIHRVQRHVQDLALLGPNWLRHLPQSVLSSFAPSEVGSDKGMTGSKTLIVATSRQDLLALDAVNAGVIKWIQNGLRDAGSLHAIKSLHANEGLITVYLSDGSVGAMLNATNGAIIGQKDSLPPFEKLVQIPGLSGPTTFRLLPDGTPQLAQDFNASTPLEGNFLVTIGEKGQAMGWTIGQSIGKMWTIRPSSGFRFVNAVGRPSHDPVASIGHVLGSRDVLYKYLSPNLALLTATSTNALTVYLIEAVTGAILHTTTHTGIDPDIPVASTISENWFAYSFYGEDTSSSTKSYQLIIAELYESDIPNDRGQLGPKTNYSSFDASVSSRPHVVSQAFTISEPIRHMSVTQTGQGITMRQLLCSLPNSNAILGIPRHILNPRRPVDRAATALEAEEGLFQYSPILDLDPKMYLTHSREVMGIKKIMSSPSLLESTTLVFVFGHDIFGTRVSPSMAFDVLGKGFNKVTLLLTVVALAAGVGALAPMVRKRQVEGRWKGM